MRQRLFRAGIGAAGNSLGQLTGSQPFNSGALIGSTLGRLLGGFYAPATWNVGFKGSFGSQLVQRIISGMPGAGVTSTSNFIGTKLWGCK